MSDTLQYLIKHGYIVLFASVLAQQLGVPLPSAGGLEGWWNADIPYRRARIDEYFTHA